MRPAGLGAARFLLGTLPALAADTDDATALRFTRDGALVRTLDLDAL